MSMIVKSISDSVSIILPDPDTPESQTIQDAQIIVKVSMAGNVICIGRRRSRVYELSFSEVPFSKIREMKAFLHEHIDKRCLIYDLRDTPLVGYFTNTELSIDYSVRCELGNFSLTFEGRPYAGT